MGLIMMFSKVDSDVKAENSRKIFQGVFQKSDASGQKRGGFETVFVDVPKCVA